MLKVYPRACGGTCSGLVGALYREGSIPAHAGEPPPEKPLRDFRGVYPRACGGTSFSWPAQASTSGLSPRMRGNQSDSRGLSQRRRSIPAHAGEPAQDRIRPGCRGVYPRACGGTTAKSRAAGRLTGLSPRMRGNRSPAPSLAWPGGSIPAHAGEPTWELLTKGAERVYPRACGGTAAPRPAGIRM